MAVATAPELSWQGSLFAQGDTVPDPHFATSRRIDLDATAWVEISTGWLAGSDELFRRLVQRLQWTSNEMPMYGQLVTQPRLSAWWDLGDEAVREPLVASLATAIGRRYQVAFTSVGANLYRDGRDSVAWHADRNGRDATAPDVVIAVLSLGAPRRFAIRPRAGGPARAFTVCGGDLLVMGGSCQRTWHHCVPKQAEAGPRMSLTFRYQPTCVAS